MRHGFNVDPNERDLEEDYLPAFRATVTEGHVDSVMCAYNSIDKFAACTNQMLLKNHLRDAWGFKGFVVSDCGAIVDVFQGHKQQPDIEHASAESLKAGTDLSCSIWTPGFNSLASAVKQGLVSEDLITQAAERLYTARFELGLFDPQGSNPLDKTQFSVVAGEVNRAQALKAAEKSIVLLKNDGILPLKKPARDCCCRSDSRPVDFAPRQLRRHATRSRHAARRRAARVQDGADSLRAGLDAGSGGRACRCRERPSA